MVLFSFKCSGHPNVTALHKSTLEFTTDSGLTLRGDCILGVKATSNLPNLPNEIKNLVRKENANVKVILVLDGYTEEIEGKGNPKLQLLDDTAIIIRKSDFICPRTLMINANKAAIDIPPNMRELMKDPDSIMDITNQVEEGAIETSKQA
jgi:hypothetical protein